MFNDKELEDIKSGLYIAMQKLDELTNQNDLDLSDRLEVISDKIDFIRYGVTKKT